MGLWDQEKKHQPKGADKNQKLLSISVRSITNLPNVWQLQSFSTTWNCEVAANLSVLFIPHDSAPTLVLASKRQDNYFNEHAIICAVIKINDSKTLSKNRLHDRKTWSLNCCERHTIVNSWVLELISIWENNFIRVFLYQNLISFQMETGDSIRFIWWINGHY